MPQGVEPQSLPLAGSVGLNGLTLPRLEPLIQVAPPRRERGFESHGHPMAYELDESLPLAGSGGLNCTPEESGAVVLESLPLAGSVGLNVIPNVISFVMTSPFLPRSARRGQYGRARFFSYGHRTVEPSVAPQAEPVVYLHAINNKIYGKCMIIIYTMIYCLQPFTPIQAFLRSSP